MKKIFRTVLTVAFAGLVFNACETTDLDLRVSPNDLAISQADPNLILNSIQLAGVSNMDRFNQLSAQLTRIEYMGGRIYFNNFQGGVMNSVWARTYSSEFNLAGSGVDVGLFTNVDALKEINANSDINYDFHVAVGQTIKAYSLLLLTDFIGQAAFTQAGNPDEFPAPILDDGPVVYDGALSLLDEAEALFATNPPTQGATDFYYGGDSTKWIKLINSIRLRTHFLTGNTAAFNAVIAGNNFISDVADDFQFQYGSRVLQPDTRHPEYANDYSPTGAGGYLSNWLMETMRVKEDPRIRYYFYRQVDATPGADADPDEQFLSCSLFTVPQHFIDGGFTTFCSVPNGYWGRNHGNDEGTPPDGFFKTAYGVYPAAGRFDDNSFGTIGLGQGGGGAGIRPIILASYVDFWRGAMATTPAAKAEFLRSAMEKSIEKVQPFAALDGNADRSFEPTATEVSDYIDDTIAAFLAASGDAQEDIFAEQYWIAQWGGAQEAWNYYRKTGYPTTLSPSWEPDPGPFPRSFFYPQDEVITNPNLQQRADLTTQVFWDTNPASPTFPQAN